MLIFRILGISLLYGLVLLLTACSSTIDAEGQQVVIGAAKDACRNDTFRDCRAFSIGSSELCNNPSESSQVLHSVEEEWIVEVRYEQKSTTSKQWVNWTTESRVIKDTDGLWHVISIFSGDLSCE